jgi:hypothetical protein
MKCSKRTGDGIPCGAEAQSDSIYCFMHDDRPETILKRNAARSAGGKAKPRGVPVRVDVSSPDAILETLRAVAQSLADGDTDRSTANAMAYLLTGAVQARKALRYEERLRAVERRLGLVEPTLAEEDAEDADNA